MMYFKNVILLLIVCFSNDISAQNQETCHEKLIIMESLTRRKNFDDAREPLQYLLENCEEFDLKIYNLGERILSNKINKSSTENRKAIIYDLVDLWNKRIINYRHKTSQGLYNGKLAQLLYVHQKTMQITDGQLYEPF